MSKINLKMLLMTLTLSLLAGSLLATSPASLLGKKAPKLESKKSYNTSTGSGIDLNTYKGHVVLLDFWATWCGPCISSMPHLVDLHKKYKNKGLIIIGHTDSTSRDIKSFLKAKKMDFIISVGSKVFDPSFGVTGIPQAFLIDTKGKVVWQGSPGNLRESAVTNQLKNFNPRALDSNFNYPMFLSEKKPTARLASIEKSINSGKIGSGVSSLKKMLLSTSSEEDRVRIEENLKTVDTWIVSQESQIKSLLSEGDDLLASAKISKLSKALGRHEKNKTLKRQLIDVKRSKNYKIGLAFVKFQKKLKRKKPEVMKKGYANFAAAYPNSFYGKQAKELSK